MIKCKQLNIKQSKWALNKKNEKFKYDIEKTIQVVNFKLVLWVIYLSI